ncbi:hypothetical protein PR202_gb26587 [Eleusine coracana subsp. coracana]|uniref:RING-type E3 ubiquitin transferase n=1 Tax=Eleusine coracana subsp. coracana TaxID=191504 RepID=A0AAV5FS91_ELECO|nr:hypothetical protein QOZ80_1BG0056710 [Eleusine coracana subsp. coracana]GJN37613.1 hypothetical protein PR202_gb26587 [Eleusine coracana subsp. coracana]
MEGRRNGSFETKHFDCRICSKPLRPPIFECNAGHFFCLTCRNKIPYTRKLPVCCKGASARSHGMESVVVSIRVDCANAEHGCTKKVMYYDKEEHEKACPHMQRYCYCPGCNFSGSSAELWEHCSLAYPDQQHGKLVTFSYFEPFDINDTYASPDWYLLRSKDDGQIFVLNVKPAAPPISGHAVSLVCVQPGATWSKYGCSLSFSCFKGHHGSSTLYSVPRSSLSHGLPRGFFCLVPFVARSANGFVLTVTIDTEMDYDGVDELTASSCMRMISCASC